MSMLERNHFRSDVMPKHEKLYDSKDCQDCGDKVATRRMDSPDDHEDPLSPLSGATKDTGQQQPASYIASERNYGSTAYMNDKNHEDAMSGASNHNQLPISFFKSTAGRLRDVNATIGARAARRANIMIGINSRANELGYDSDLMAFEPDLWCDDAIMIGAYSPGDVTATIGNPAPTKNTPTLEVVNVMNFESIGYLVHNAILIFLILLADSGVVMTFWYCEKVYLRRASRRARPCRAS